MRELIFEFSDVYMDEIEEFVSPEDSCMLLGDICINRIAGIAYKNLSRFKNFRVHKEFVKTLDAVYKENIRKTEHFKRNIKYLSNIFKDADFSYAFLKGSFLTTKLYESGCRTSNDIDILINEKDITNCQNILLNAGFIQGEFKPGTGIIPATRREVIMSRMNFGETIPFIKIIDGEPLCIDLNFSVDFKPAGENQIVPELLANTTEVQFEEVSFRTLNKIDFLIHLCCHLYKEATIINWVRGNRDLQLYKFSDINIFFHECILEEDYKELAKSVAKFGVEKECYYTFENASVIYPKLKQLNGYEAMLDEIRPGDLSFMKQILDPMDKKLYQYDMTFKEWFLSRKRVNELKNVEVL